MLDVLAEGAAVVLLEEAFLRAPLRAADQGHRAPRGVDHDQRLDRGVIVREVALGQAFVGEDRAFRGC